MNTIAIVTNEQDNKPILQEFDDSISVSDILTDSIYSYQGDTYNHKLYKHLPTNTDFVYKQYEPESYQVLKAIQAVVFNRDSVPATTIFALGYNKDLDKVETIEKLIKGPTIGEILAEPEFTFNFYDLVQLASCLCYLLELFEDQSIIIRDLSPQNIIYEHLSYPYLIDLDACCLHKADTYINDKPLGTIGYASPEHFESNQVTAKSDVYSLGMILNELLPQLSTDEWDHPEAVQVFKETILKMISVDPDKRPQAYSLIFLLEDLASSASDEEFDREEVESYLAY